MGKSPFLHFPCPTLRGLAQLGTPICPVIKCIALIALIYVHIFLSQRPCAVPKAWIRQTWFLFESSLSGRVLLPGMQSIQMFKEWMNKGMGHEPAILFYAQLYFLEYLSPTNFKPSLSSFPLSLVALSEAHEEILLKMSAHLSFMPPPCQITCNIFRVNSPYCLPLIIIFKVVPFLPTSS